MMKSVLSQFEANSPLAENEALRPNQKRSSVKSLVASPVLTPLVDVFAILVIYLLVHSVDPTILEFNKHNIDLPRAVTSSSVEAGLVVSILDGKILFEDSTLSLSDLRKKLDSLKNDENNNNKRLTIVGDKNTSFEALSPILEICSDSGIQEVQFAILRKAKS
ncbi:MAG: biopolymer transporter ExbD [Bdellovibrionales bacterium]